MLGAISGCSGCSGPGGAAYDDCGTPGSRLYLEATVDGVPVSRCVPGAGSTYLGHESATTPGDPYHRIINLYAACPTGAACLSPTELDAPPLCGVPTLNLFNVDPSTPSEGPLLPRAAPYYDGTFTDTSVTLLVATDRPDHVGLGGQPASCANSGEFTWNVSGHYRVLNGAMAGERMIVEVSDARVLDPPPGHSIEIHYLRWEFVLDDLDVFP